MILILVNKILIIKGNCLIEIIVSSFYIINLIVCYINLFYILIFFLLEVYEFKVVIKY